MPEIKHAMRAAAQETRAVDHVGFALDQGPQQRGIFAGIVFQVGVLNDDEVSGRFRMPRRKAAPFPMFFGWENRNCGY